MLGAANHDPLVLHIMTDREKYRVKVINPGYDPRELAAFVQEEADRSPVIFASGIETVQKLVVQSADVCQSATVVAFDEPAKLVRLRVTIIDAERTDEGHWRTFDIGKRAVLDNYFKETEPGLSRAAQSVLCEKRGNPYQPGGKRMARRKKSWVEQIAGRVVKSISDPDKADTYREAVYQYMCGVRSKRSFKSSMKGAVKAGADDDKIRGMDKEMDGDESSLLMDAYYDVAVLGTTIEEAAEDHNADEASLRFLIEKGWPPFEDMEFVWPPSYALVKLRLPEACGVAIPKALYGEDDAPEDPEEEPEDEGEEEEEPEDEGEEEEEPEDEGEDEEEEEDGDEDGEEEDEDEDDEDEGDELGDLDDDFGDDEDGEEEEEDEDEDEDDEDEGDELGDFDDDFGDEDEDEDEEPPPPPAPRKPPPPKNRTRARKPAARKKTVKKKKTAKKKPARKKTTEKKPARKKTTKKKVTRKPAKKKTTKKKAAKKKVGKKKAAKKPSAKRGKKKKKKVEKPATRSRSRRDDDDNGDFGDFD